MLAKSSYSFAPISNPFLLEIKADTGHAPFIFSQALRFFSLSVKNRGLFFPQSSNEAFAS